MKPSKRSLDIGFLCDFYSFKTKTTSVTLKHIHTQNNICIHWSGSCWGCCSLPQSLLGLWSRESLRFNIHCLRSSEVSHTNITLYCWCCVCVETWSLKLASSWMKYLLCKSSSFNFYLRWMYNFFLAVEGLQVYFLGGNRFLNSAFFFCCQTLLW